MSFLVDLSRRGFPCTPLFDEPWLCPASMRSPPPSRLPAKVPFHWACSLLLLGFPLPLFAQERWYGRCSSHPLQHGFFFSPKCAVLSPLDYSFVHDFFGVFPPCSLLGLFVGLRRGDSRATSMRFLHAFRQNWSPWFFSGLALSFSFPLSPHVSPFFFLSLRCFRPLYKNPVFPVADLRPVTSVRSAGRLGPSLLLHNPLFLFMEVRLPQYPLPPALTRLQPGYGFGESPPKCLLPSCFPFLFFSPGQGVPMRNVPPAPFAGGWFRSPPPLTFWGGFLFFTQGLRCSF